MPSSAKLMPRRKTISQQISNFLFSTMSRELLVFFFFLLLASVFWLLMTLNETYEKEYDLPVNIVNLPKNVVLTSGEDDTLKVKLRDKGLLLLGYMYGDRLKPISVDYATYSKKRGQGSVPASDIQKEILRQLSASTRLVSVKPEAIDFTFNYGESKLVPVKWSGKVQPEHLYYIAETIYSPDSITIYASEDILDSINVVYTEPLNLTNFRDTITINSQISKTRGVKMVPSEVSITFLTDVLTEESIDGIPVVGINLPEGKRLRTFPARVSVSFVAGVSLFKNLSADDFQVVADYNEIKRGQSDKCRLILQKTPRGISRASLVTKEVDYLIEEE